MPQTQGVPHISLRHLKALAYVARHKNLTRAAKELNRSQTAITKAIGELETQFEIPLFERSPAGMKPTLCGEKLAHWVELAEAEFRAAGASYQNIKVDVKDASKLSVFSMSISYKRLASFIALYDHRDTKIAAQHLGVTRAAISGAVRELEDLLELSLFERDTNGIHCSPFCLQLARHLKLAFAHLRHGIDDIASLDGVTYGTVAVGTLPYTRTVLIPRAMNRVLKSHPQLEVSTTEGRYAQLEVALRSGDLDFIVGATRPLGDEKELVTETLFEDRLAVIVRTGHPLTKQEKVTLGDLQHYRWILPARNTPARLLFDRELSQDHLPRPEHTIETSSLSTVRGLLLESDSVALLSEHQIYFDKLYGVLTALPIALNHTYRPIGVTMRVHSHLSPAAQLFLEQLRQVAQEMPKQ
ncbi:LysR family transcriptional regulator [Aestuariicella hydrocarbonica]|uniref:LysR family transcriptional regulator n=1 Tax=Pseudomaricurvus hydrocarbonicus TaxID=1470433 RepID=A0A9E5JWK1_9GAMM|nr:LysR family transcriptional regulator [Aestuariicella hydrocarbonica]